MSTRPSTASAVEQLFVLGCVVFGAFMGAIVPIGVAYMIGQGYLGAFLGMLVGGAVGFVTSSLVVSMSMNLAETARNTRQLVQIMRQNSGSKTEVSEQPPVLSVESHASPGHRASWKSVKEDPRFRKFENAANELSENSKGALRRAKELGYVLAVKSPGMLVLERDNEGAFYFVSNADIEDLAREKGWIP